MKDKENVIDKTVDTLKDIVEAPIDAVEAVVKTVKRASKSKRKKAKAKSKSSKLIIKGPPKYTKKLSEHLKKEHPSTKKRMKLVPKQQNHNFTKILDGEGKKAIKEKIQSYFDVIKSRLTEKDIECVTDADKKKITDFRLIKSRNLINGRKLNILNWNDWVTVNNTINDVLDKFAASANVSTLGGKFKVREGKERMTEDDWEHLAEENVGSVMQPMSRREYAPRA